MFSTPWICARCLRSLPRARRSYLNRRWQSTPSITDSISPGLLSRARSIANEHATLAEKLAGEYDAKAAKRMGELSSTATALKDYEHAVASLSELQALLRSPEKELQEMAIDEVEPTHQRISHTSDALKSSLVPVHPFEHLPCLVEIRPGAGGDEAALFAGDLLHMYEAFCVGNGLKTTVMTLETADYTGSSTGAGGNIHVQEAILEVETPGAYGTLRCEAGVHRVQRVPATESKGRVHTSAASVLVLPSIPSQASADAAEDDSGSDSYVDPKDVRTDVLRSSGAGGQHVNKTESAVRLTHIPTGTVVNMQEQRSQLKNREKAWQVLRSRIAQQRREEREEEESRMRRGAGAGRAGRENKIRTYNYGQQRVSDHRSGIDVRNLDEVMEGGPALERVMASVRAWMVEQEVLSLAAEEESQPAGGK